MNKKITILDLMLNSKNWGEHPKKIKYQNNIYEYNEKIMEYRDKNDFPLVINLLEYSNKVEILEEDEDIEEIENYPDVLDWKEEYGIDRALKEQSEFNEKVFNRLNELSKEVNKLRKESK